MTAPLYLAYEARVENGVIALKLGVGERGILVGLTPESARELADDLGQILGNAAEEAERQLSEAADAQITSAAAGMLPPSVSRETGRETEEAERG